MSAARQPEPTVTVAVEVTFLRMAARPDTPAPPLPSGYQVVSVPHCSVAFYRYLYDTVGRDWLWWLRRTATDAEVAAMLANPQIAIRVLYRGGEPAGFYELERRADRTVNLSYFGLMPHAIGQGVGFPLLRHAIDAAWGAGCAALTVNTCTADHPRALPNYLAAGFSVVRSVRETWPIPRRLNLPIPERLRLV